MVQDCVCMFILYGARLRALVYIIWCKTACACIYYMVQDCACMYLCVYVGARACARVFVVLLLLLLLHCLYI